MDLGDLRALLGAEFEYGPGHWFSIPHGEALRRDGEPFSRKGGTHGRPVVLISKSGPNATGYARSTSVEVGFPHPPHAHDVEELRCAVELYGWIAYKVPIPISKGMLRDETFSCRDPDAEGLLYELRRVSAR